MSNGTGPYKISDANSSKGTPKTSHSSTPTTSILQICPNNESNKGYCRFWLIQKIENCTIERCEGANQNTIINIVKGSPEIKHIKCPTKEGIDMRLLDDLYHMKNRKDPIKISINKGNIAK